MGVVTWVSFLTNSRSNSQQEKILASKKEDFNRQLEALAEPLGHLFDETSSKYKGMIFPDSFQPVYTNFDHLDHLIQKIFISRSPGGC